VKPHSQTSATTDHTIPVASLAPVPTTSTLPAVTTTAAAATAGAGRCRWTSGPSTPRKIGAQATATAMTAGSACATPRTTAMLNTTRPLTATPASQSHSRPRGRRGRCPAAARMPTSSKAASPYRIACAVNRGASIKAWDTPTLLPTRAMPATPALTARAVVGRIVEVVIGPLCGKNGPMDESIEEGPHRSKGASDFLSLRTQPGPSPNLGRPSYPQTAFARA
jgi:hypothetical protein